jgi:hypothetical protein
MPVLDFIEAIRKRSKVSAYSRHEATVLVLSAQPKLTPPAVARDYASLHLQLFYLRMCGLPLCLLPLSDFSGGVAGGIHLVFEYRTGVVQARQLLRRRPVVQYAAAAERPAG